jgi:hypothetical protein
MHRLGLEPTIPVFEGAKTFHDLDRAATALPLEDGHPVIHFETQCAVHVPADFRALLS